MADSDEQVSTTCTLSHSAQLSSLEDVPRTDNVSHTKQHVHLSPAGLKSTKFKGDSRSSQRLKQLQFPLSRIRTIMKCAPDVANINQECVYVMTKATELFVEEFSRTACNQAAKAGRIYINYDDLADCVQAGNFKLRFLNDVVPQKILARDALEYYHKKVNQFSLDQQRQAGHTRKTDETLVE